MIIFQFPNLPEAINELIFLYCGNYHQSLIKDLNNFGTFYGIYKSLHSHGNSKNGLKKFAKKSFFERLRTVYDCSENFVVSYVQEYESFHLFPYTYLVSLIKE
jgi:hypothetical protein